MMSIKIDFVATTNSNLKLELISFDSRHDFSNSLLYVFNFQT